MKFKFENGIIDIRIKTEGNNPDGYEWINAILEVSTQSGFRAIQRINIYVFDLKGLYESLIHLKNGDIKTFAFNTLESELSLEGEFDLTGNINWNGIVESRIDRTNLHFYLKSDNASIGHFADEVWKTLQEYPVAKK